MTLIAIGVRSRPLGRVFAMVTASVLCVLPSAANAWIDPGDDSELLYDPHGALVIDGSYVMNVGELQINITNWGLIGSKFSSATYYSHAPSAQWPAGSGHEYLYAAGLWVGGVLLGERLVSHGSMSGIEHEIRAQDNVEDTIYEAVGGALVRPLGFPDASGKRYPEPNPNDDEDFDEDTNEARIDEEILNGYDDDDDGLIEEDFGQIGSQMMVTTTYDNTRAAASLFPDHKPLNLKVVQESFAWENDQVDDFVGFQYTITNVGVVDISNIYIGFYADSDIGPREGISVAGDDMAGSFSGAVKASDGSWVPVEVGFMWDAAEENRIDGYFGVAFLGHDTDPEGLRAPASVALRTFQRFSGEAPFDQGGDPTNDAERYELLSAAPEDRDPDVQPGRDQDYRFLISAGPFQILRADEDLEFQVAMVVGPGRAGMLAHCAEAALTWYGNYFDVVTDQENEDGDLIVTGENGRESIICREDFGDPTLFDTIYPDFGDVTCVDPGYLLNTQTPLNPDEVFVYRDGAEAKHCAMINMDNCFECFRQKRHEVGETAEVARCSQYDIEEYWNCWKDGEPVARKAGCTGIEGRETQVNWLVGMAPPAPGMRLWPTDNRMHVYWDNTSEITADVRLGQIDFESYRVWRAENWTRPWGASVENGPGSNLWQMVAEYDVVNSFIADYIVGPGDTVRDTLALGPNTGLDAISYHPVVLDDPYFAQLADDMQQVVDADSEGFYTSRPPIYDEDSNVIPGSEPLERWSGYPDVMDTFWAVTVREESSYVDPISEDEVVVIVGKDATEYYEYIDPFAHNGFLYFYSVTATDHELQLIPETDPAEYRIVGPGQAGDPASSFDYGSPATDSQSADDRAQNGANIFVYPNPATRAALTEFQEMAPNSEDPTGVRVKWANLPQAHNTIRIYSVAGDLIETIDHDGTEGYGEAYWNLMSRNGQEVVSGIYMYVVQSDDGAFEDFIGKFVLVR